MNLFGIGPLELVFILLIMIVVLGPKKMVESAQSLGKFIRKIVKSPMWGTVMDTSRELRDLPNKLVREAGIEEDLRELQKTKQTLTDIRNYSVSDNLGSKRANLGDQPAKSNPLDISEKQPETSTQPEAEVLEKNTILPPEDNKD